MSGTRNTLSQMYMKGIDYFTEEYIVQLLQIVTTDKNTSLNPFVGTIFFPSGQFFVGANNDPSVQFAATTYVGLMDFLLPFPLGALDGAMAYTKLTFMLDGVPRTFIQLIGGDNANSLGVKFSTYIQSLFPDANLELPYNHTAIHVLRELKIEGSAFDLTGGNFVAAGYTSGAHTPNFRFQIAVSGYSAILQ